MCVKLFLDTAELWTIQGWHARGMVDGVTTNAALLAEFRVVDMGVFAADVGRLKVPVSLPVLHSGADAMIRAGLCLRSLGNNVVVKIPGTDAGYEATKHLVSLGIPCNVTFVFDPATAVAFLRLNPAYLSIILDRNEDFGTCWETEELLAATLAVADRLSADTQIIAASIRHPKTLCRAIASGAHVVTVPPKTWATALANPLAAHEERRALDAYATWRGSQCN